MSLRKTHQLMLSWPTLEKGTTLGISERCLDNFMELVKNAKGLPVYQFVSVNSILDSPHQYQIGEVSNVKFEDHPLITVEYHYGKAPKDESVLVPITLGKPVPNYEIYHVSIEDIEELMGFMLYPLSLIKQHLN